MITTLKKHGNSRALIVSRETMEQMGIAEDTPLQVTVRDGNLIVTPSNIGIDREQFEASTKRVMSRYDKMLKRLAE